MSPRPSDADVAELGAVLLAYYPRIGDDAARAWCSELLRAAPLRVCGEAVRAAALEVSQDRVDLRALLGHVHRRQRELDPGQRRLDAPSAPPTPGRRAAFRAVASAVACGVIETEGEARDMWSAMRDLDPELAHELADRMWREAGRDPRGLDRVVGCLGMQEVER